MKFDTESSDKCNDLRRRVQAGRKLFHVGHEPVLDWMRSVELVDPVIPQPDSSHHIRLLTHRLSESNVTD